MAVVLVEVMAGLQIKSIETVEATHLFVLFELL